jgi:hypothetical protein
MDEASLAILLQSFMASLDQAVSTEDTPFYAKSQSLKLLLACSQHCDWLQKCMTFFEM